MVDKSEKFNMLVRVGYASRGVLYTMLGIIALTSADEIAKGTDGVFQAVEDFPAGTAILWILVVGLIAYALFRLSSAILDIEHHGTDTKGIAVRVGHAASAIAHLALAYSAYKFATTVSDAQAASGDGAQEAAAGILSAGLGSIVLGAIGIGFLIGSVQQARRAINGRFMNRISARAPNSTRWFGAIGYLARAVVYVVIGVSLVRSAWFSRSQEVKTLGDAVASLSGTGVLFMLVAIGLILFGLYNFVEARYRIIPHLGAQGRVPAYRS